MAILLTYLGDETRIGPLNGIDFTLADVQSLFETLTIESLDIGHERVLVFDGDGHRKPMNQRASVLAKRHGYDSEVTGHAMIAERKELQWIKK